MGHDFNIVHVYTALGIRPSRDLEIAVDMWALINQKRIWVHMILIMKISGQYGSSSSNNSELCIKHACAKPSDKFFPTGMASHVEHRVLSRFRVSL